MTNIVSCNKYDNYNALASPVQLLLKLYKIIILSESVLIS